MKRLAYILAICAVGVVLFSASKVLWGGHTIFSWGIFICAIVFVISLFLLLFKLEKIGERAK